MTLLDPTAASSRLAEAPVDTDGRLNMIRHEDRLLVAVERFPLERARMEFAVSEEQPFTVTVRREEVRLVRTPLDPDAPLTDGAAAGAADPIVMTVHAERPTISTEIVPVERVWLSTETITEQHTVTDTVGHGEIDIVTTPLLPSSGSETLLAPLEGPTLPSRSPARPPGRAGAQRRVKLPRVMSRVRSAMSAAT